MINEYISLLSNLVATPSLSRDEGQTASIIEAWLNRHGVVTERVANNIVARSCGYNPEKPTLMLNSHHDTVKPNAGYTRERFVPTIENGRMY